MHNTTRQGVAVGFFDGVHLGHRAILEGAACALTFREHPLTVISPEDAPRLIMPLKDRLETLQSLGLQQVAAIPFNKLIANMPPAAFARKVLWSLAARNVPHGSKPVVRCGESWRFGRDASGDVGLLEHLGFDVQVVPFKTLDGKRISSTRIRNAIENGEVERATLMLSRPWCTTGRITPGKGLGRSIGFPTANIIPESMELQLPRGVYIVLLDGHPAVSNWGTSPTLLDRAWTQNILEIHVLDGAPESDAKLHKVEFLCRLRDEQRFNSIDELKDQIANDCIEARCRLSKIFAIDE